MVPGRFGAPAPEWERLPPEVRPGCPVSPGAGGGGGSGEGSLEGGGGGGRISWAPAGAASARARIEARRLMSSLRRPPRARGERAMAGHRGDQKRKDAPARRRSGSPARDDSFAPVSISANRPSRLVKRSSPATPTRSQRQPKPPFREFAASSEARSW